MGKTKRTQPRKRTQKLAIKKPVDSTATKEALRARAGELLNESPADDERYGKNREKLPDDQLRAIARNICLHDDPAGNLVLLMDEIERASFDRFDVAAITITVSDAAFADTLAFSDARDAMIGRLREERGAA